MNTAQDRILRCRRNAPERVPQEIVVRLPAIPRRFDVIQVRPCPDPKFGDYQTSSLMTLAKQRKINPRQLAADVLSRLDASAWCEQIEIAGAGFLNFHLKTSALAATLEAVAR